MLPQNQNSSLVLHDVTGDRTKHTNLHSGNNLQAILQPSARYFDNSYQEQWEEVITEILLIGEAVPASIYTWRRRQKARQARHLDTCLKCNSFKNVNISRFKE